MTDTATIFALVSRQRASVYASVVVQLISAAAYVVGAQLLASAATRASRTMRAGCALLAVGRARRGQRQPRARRDRDDPLRASDSRHAAGGAVTVQRGL